MFRSNARLLPSPISDDFGSVRTLSSDSPGRCSHAASFTSFDFFSPLRHLLCWSFRTDRSLTIRPDSFFNILRFISADGSFTIWLARPDAMSWGRRHHWSTPSCAIRPHRVTLSGRVPMSGVPLSYPLRSAIRRSLGRVEATSPRAWISSVCVGRGELVGRSASISDQTPGDVQLGHCLSTRANQTPKIWQDTCKNM
jgi:hypothetical protein